MNAISGNLVFKISDHLPQFLIVGNLKVNYKVLNYYKISHLVFYTGITSQAIIWIPTLNLTSSMIR